MKFNIKKILNLCFFVLFLLSFFLIEGDYRFYLFAAWSVFLLSFSNFLEKKNFPKSVLLALILSGLFILSSFFSKQLPLSLEKLLFYILSIAIFIFFRLLPKSNFNKSLFFHYLSIVVLILNFLVLFLTFFALPENIFPGMNLIVRSYGHNHYAAFLLLVVPIFWWQFLFSQDEDWFSKKESKFLAIILLVSSYLLVIFSLGRLALFISLLQLILIFFLNKKAFLITGKNEFGQVMVKAFIFAFLSIGSVFMFLSTPLNQKGDSLCPLIFSKKEVCKSFIQNDRLIYWKKAILIFKENPYFGSGLKNFNFASRHFPSEKYQSTSYAHNIFLHNLAESGLFAGGFFIFFIIYLFYKSFAIMRKNKEPLNIFLYLAALASIANALFDFDWNFFVIFSLTLIFLAIILQSEDLVLKNNSKKKSLKNYFICVAVVACFFASASMIADFLLKKNDSNSLIKFFPYLDNQIRFLINSKTLKVNNYQSLYSLYKNDPDFLYNFYLSDDLNLDKKSQLQIEFAEIDPLFFSTNIDFKAFSYKEAQPLVGKFIEVVQKYQFLNNVNFLDYWRQRNLSKEFFYFGEQAYKDKNPTTSSWYYQKALILNPFIMGDVKASFLDEKNYEQTAIFLKYFKDFNPESMNKNFYSYMDFYDKTLIYLFQNDRLDEFFVLAEAIFKQQPNFSWFVFRDLVAASKTPEEKERLQKVHEHFKDLST